MSPVNALIASAKPVDTQSYVELAIPHTSSTDSNVFRQVPIAVASTLLTEPCKQTPVVQALLVQALYSVPLPLE